MDKIKINEMMNGLYQYANVAKAISKRFYYVF